MEVLEVYQSEDFIWKKIYVRVCSHAMWCSYLMVGCTFSSSLRKFTVIKMASTRVKFVTKVYAVSLVYTDTSASCFMSCYKTGNGELGDFRKGECGGYNLPVVQVKQDVRIFNTIKLIFAVLLIKVRTHLFITDVLV
jgi:hypothetical protein